MRQFFLLFRRLVAAVEEIAHHKLEMSHRLERQLNELERRLEEHIAAKRHTSGPRQKDKSKLVDQLLK